MKRVFAGIIAILLMASICACGEKAPTWQEQYDLGVRYLEEGNYEEAVIAFTAAIEIDPKQAPAYAGRGDVYIKLAESQNGTEETEASKANYERALDDYLVAIELDGTIVELYQKAAASSLALGDYDTAISILNQGNVKTGDEGLRDFLLELSTDKAAVSISNDAITTFEDYIEPEELSEEQIDFIQDLITYIEAEDTATLYLLRAEAFNVLPLYNDTMVYFYSFVGSYKLHIYASTEYDTLEIELRSYDEGAYYCEVCSSDVIPAEYDFMKGTCENWQWNGEVTGTRDERWHDGTLFYQETYVVAKSNHRVGESRKVSYWHGLEAGEPSICTEYYTEEDNMPLPWGIHEEW